MLSASGSKSPAPKEQNMTKSSSVEFALVGGGCFWCTEAVFEKIEGVLDVVSGYAGGTYILVCRV